MAVDFTSMTLSSTFKQIVLLGLVILILSSDVGFSKRMKDNGGKMKTQYLIPMNRTLEEELHIVKETVLTVKSDLYDITTDVKGLHKTLRQAENRISQIEKKLREVGKAENEVTSSSSTAEALMEKIDKGDIPENSAPKDEGHAPQFLEKYSLPNEITVKVGQTATLRCPVTGNPTPRIMWLKDQKLFARKMAMTEAIKWKLNLHQVDDKDRGNYSCLLTNTHGTIKHTFALHVIEEPRTTEKPTKMPTTIRATTEKPPSMTSAKPMKKPKRKNTTPQKSAPSKIRLRERPSKPPVSDPTETKPPPRNQMATEAPPIWRVPSAMNSREIIGDEEKCEATVAAEGTAPMRDCWDLKMYHCVDRSGVYNVSVDNQVYSVYCDMATDGGGWIVFQKRFNGKVDFNRDWEDYKAGFGRMTDGEFWWGNEKLFVFTRDRRMRVRIDMADELNTTFVEYDGFWISRESDYYRLNVEGFRGRGGEAFIQPVWEEESHHKMMFSTRDMDRDGSLANCAAHFGGGWWYNDCYAANLNGIYPRKKEKKTPSLQWKPWQGAKKYLTEVTMKIRPAIAPSSVTWDFWYPEKDDSFRLHEHYQIYGGCC